MADVRNFNPYIVCVNRGTIPSDLEMFERMCIWYELELVIRGEKDSGVITLDEFIPARPGTLFLRRPGDLVCGAGVYSFVTILFDVIWDSSLEHLYEAKLECVKSDVDIPFLRRYYSGGRRNFPFLEAIPRIMHLNDYEWVLRAMQEIVDMEEREDSASKFHAKASLMSLISQLSQESAGDSRLFVKYPPAVSQAQTYIRENYMNAISLENMADHVSLNREYFCRLFKQHTRLTPMNYLLKQRIYHAKLLLLSEDIAVEEIANRCGFRDLSYFYTAFKKQTGLSPGQYKAQRPYGRIYSAKNAERYFTEVKEEYL